MSKVLRIDQGGYKIITQPGSEIKLDTGLGIGTVRVTGDLIVEGGTTNLEVQDLLVEDNIIEINIGGGDNDGILSGTLINQEAGLLVHRGNLESTYIVWDEKIERKGPTDNNLKKGIFVFREGEASANNLVGISTNLIQNTYESIWFRLGTSGTLSVKTPDASPYHARSLGNDDIPNIRYLKEYVRAEAGQAVIEKFYRYALDENLNYVNTLSGARAVDSLAEDGAFSGVLFSVGTGPIDNRIEKKTAFVQSEGILVGNKYNPDAYHLNLFVGTPDYDAGITTDNADLTISPDTGVIKLKKVLHIENYQGINDPSVVQGNNVIYSKQDQGAGGTGLYFANQNTAGELCSAAKALVYGLIF